MAIAPYVSARQGAGLDEPERREDSRQEFDRRTTPLAALTISRFLSE